jgi:hypothetical protein
MYWNSLHMTRAILHAWKLLHVNVHHRFVLLACVIDRRIAADCMSRFCLQPQYVSPHVSPFSGKSDWYIGLVRDDWPLLQKRQNAQYAAGLQTLNDHFFYFEERLLHQLHNCMSTLELFIRILGYISNERVIIDRCPSSGSEGGSIIDAKQRNRAVPHPLLPNFARLLAAMWLHRSRTIPLGGHVATT